MANWPVTSTSVFWLTSTVEEISLLYRQTIVDSQTTYARVPPFVDTGSISARSYHLVGAELAANLGPLHFMMEGVGAFVHPIS
jgi:hypothetical protein